jgi:hypothetical protein
MRRIARSVIEGCRGEHTEFVFTRDGKPVAGINNSGWKAARRRAAKRYTEGVAFEYRKLLLGHKSNHVTTHYSAPELGALIRASEMVCDLGSRKSPAIAIVRTTADRAKWLKNWWKGRDSSPRPGIIPGPSDRSCSSGDSRDGRSGSSGISPSEGNVQTPPAAIANS